MNFQPQISRGMFAAEKDYYIHSARSNRGFSIVSNILLKVFSLFKLTNMVQCLIITSES